MSENYVKIEQHRLNHDAKSSVLMLYAGWNLIQDNIPALESYFRETKNGWRDARLMMRLVGTVIDHLLDVCDKETLEGISRQLAQSQVAVLPKAFGRRDSGWYITDDDLAILLDAIFSECCTMCTATPGEQKKCKLRRVLNKMPLQGSIFPDGNTACPYMLAHAQSDGKEA